MKLIRRRSSLTEAEIQEIIAYVEDRGVDFVKDRLCRMRNGDIVCAESMETILKAQFPLTYLQIEES